MHFLPALLTLPCLQKIRGLWKTEDSLPLLYRALEWLPQQSLSPQSSKITYLPFYL